ncbi:hypothetical protein BGZ61DRAFT_490103 [Ilyonectria robusta]|uniref:uncharacterized protein n=1 Tax=Ilyonectria robusta TaxID=1079257 RepID=UPI001E8ECD6D|nr:uncharacterized protein BGZ61DRAFT_490103 [Ilyonectria robusta]KAH8736444.1 hypothetical protein BGZ61DRAFT_490103 [Ilyonectria robusta]
MSRYRTSWDRLPPEIRNDILGLLPVLGGRCSLLATVSRAWQSIIEPLNFAEISLTIRYIWFRVELEQYDCGQCANTDRDRWGLDNIDNQFIVDAFESLFTTLSAWEPRGDLVLDISVYSPSDNQHWFKYLSFCSDTNLGECSSRRGHEQGTTLVNDPAHGWVAGQQVLAPDEFAIEQTFDEIMGEGPFDDEEPEMEWWRGLPFVPVVGVVLLRQQTRRRWKPVALANMLTRFPNLEELCYEPWREFFECPAIRVPNRAVSRKLARASLHLTTLSASFMADAGYFFAARQDLWTWDKLTSLALTSRVLTDDVDTLDINNMLRDAAAAALKMPRLDTMELWNGRRGPAIITVRGTSELALGVAARQAWDAVAYRHCHGKVVVQTSSIDPDVIRCHGDAISQLGLSTEVARPVSLQQVLGEHRFRA